jgi:hypothetical protein
MPSPCRKCGSTKTEPVHHGLAYRFVRILGYRLRKCSRCRRTRILPESLRKMRSYSQAASATSAANAIGPAAVPPGISNDFDPDGFDGCPRCGNLSFDRAPRNWIERGLGLAHMARCRSCGKRFPYPQP